MRAFVATVKLGTLSRAAESLYLSQPSISLQLQALERELGLELMQRSRRRINLTDAGEALYELAAPPGRGLGKSRSQFFKPRSKACRPADSLWRPAAPPSNTCCPS